LKTLCGQQTPHRGGELFERLSGIHASIRGWRQPVHLVTAQQNDRNIRTNRPEATRDVKLGPFSRPVIEHDACIRMQNI
jgi:hypothetical protein